MTTLELRNIVKSYKDHRVIDGLSLAIADGETLVLFGPSGAGKTVLLRAIAGLIEPDEGQVVIGGEDMTDVEAEHRGVGMAFQNFALFPHMDAFTNIASPLEARRRSKEQIKDGVEGVARLLKIDHVLSHTPRALSNGQKQRTALARALVGEPPILLLDDPLRNVDAKLRFEMRLELPRLLADRGATVVYVTQDYKEAMALGDRIAVMSEGKITQIGTPEDIYYHPANVEIARLFGDPTINLLDVMPKADASGAYIEISGVPVRLGEGLKASVGTECVLGLRPEMIRFVDAGDPGAMPVTVEVETPLNEKTVTLASTKGGRELLISRPAGTPGGKGGAAHVAIDGGMAVLFDKQTGQLMGHSAAHPARAGAAA
ncbi:MAG: ABC transporter ATP-binding protein [Rhodobiaceae bacterium]|nr:ABC transporter ATP-binding protein [Rhodobiaceae bacterium]